MISSRKHLGAKLLNSGSKLGKFFKNHSINSLNVRIQQCHSFVSFIFNFKKLPLQSQYFVFVICFTFLILVSVHFRYICVFKSYFFIEFLLLFHAEGLRHLEIQPSYCLYFVLSTCGCPVSFSTYVHLVPCDLSPLFSRSVPLRGLRPPDGS